MKIVSNQRSQVLAGRIADILDIPLIDVKFNRFPDGEIYLKLMDTDTSIILIGSFVTSDDLIELLLIRDACAFASVTMIIPYMGYARQDKQFHSGEPLSARVIAQTIGSGVSSVITINLHEKTILPYFGVPALDISLFSEIGNHIKTISCTNPLILGPDAGAADLAAQVASVGGWESDHLCKIRLSGEEVRIEPKMIPVAGRDVVIVDDIISTGGTQATATAMLYEQGARNVHTVCIHGVFSTGACTHLKSSGIRTISASDTIEGGCSAYSAAPALVRAIKKLL